MKVRLVTTLVLTLAAALSLNWFSVEGTAENSPGAADATISGPATGKLAAFAESLGLQDFAGAAKDPRKTRFSVREVSPVTEKTSSPATRKESDVSLALHSAVAMPAPSLTFDGLSNFDNISAFSLVILPSDVNGDVGPNHYVQIVNSLYRVYNKNGAAVTNAIPLNALFAPLNTVCSNRIDGLPVVLYDPLADRWLISQYCNAFPPFRQMIAITKTGDPTGPFYLYEFAMPNVRIHDLPKFGVWPDAYYMSSEEFLGADFSGMGAFAFDRAKMLAGDPTAGYVYFTRPAVNFAQRAGNLLPSDMDGLRPPPAGAPNIFAGYNATEYGQPADALRLFAFRPNFADPLASTFTERSESPLAVPAFDPTSPPERTDIVQPPPGERLDANSDRLNYRLAYRNYGGSESLVVNQTVRVSPSDPYRAGTRVYELRRTTGAFSVAEATTLGTTDASRWIASTAQDNQGNIAVGYNHVRDDKEPSIYYSGRLASEPAGAFRDEAVLVAGTGVQKAFGFRWGDYSGLVVDPVDDCTFWQTGQYFTQESEDFSEFTWLTRIGKFKFAECAAGQRALITGVVTNAASGAGIASATVTASPYSRSTNSSGSYGELAVVPGTYSVTASARGYLSQTVQVSVANGATTTLNFSLTPIPVFDNPVVAVSSESCGVNGAPDPGETVSVNIGLQNTGTIPTQNLVATLLSGNGVTNPGPPQNYGIVPVGGGPVTRTFTFTVAPTVMCGAPITLTLQLQDGTQNVGTVAITLTTGKLKIAFAENFDREQTGNLPPRWFRNSANIEGLQDVTREWRVSAARSQSRPKSLFSPDPHPVGQNEVRTPVFRVSSTKAKLSFRNWYEFETTFLRNRLYDGSLLEIKMGDGSWQDILTSGAIFESGGYDGRLDACCSNPLQGRLGWSGRSGINQTSEFITSSLRLPPNLAGQFVQFRFRVGTDIGGFREGQYIDDFVVTDGAVCGCGL